MPPSRGLSRTSGLFAAAESLRQPRIASSQSRSHLLRTYTGTSISWKPRPALISALQRPNHQTPSLLSPRSHTRLQTRFNSTATSSPFSSSAAPPTLTDTDGLPDNAGLPETTLLQPATDHIGFLREYGMDFGWGPSSVMQWTFENIHLLLGQPAWWISILCLGVAFRTVMLPLLRMSADVSARMRAVSSLVQPLQERSKAAAAKRDMIAMQSVRKEMREVYQYAGVKMSRLVLPFLVQIPLGFGCWRTLRNFAESSVPGVATGGIPGWFPNLALPDPFFILPIATGAFQYFIFDMQSRKGAAAATGANKAIMMIVGKVLPCLMPLILMFAPSAVQFYFAITSVLAISTNLALQQPFVRKLLAMSPNFDPQTQPPSSGRTINVSTTSRQSPITAEPTQSFNGKYGVGAAKKAFSSIKASVMPEANKNMSRRKERLQQDRAKQFENRRQKEIDAQKNLYQEDSLRSQSNRRR